MDYLLTASQSRQWDAWLIEQAGETGDGLMRRAGRAAFDCLRTRWPAARDIAVFCGPGNNGGDGYVLAALARAAGLDARVFEVGAGAAPEALERRPMRRMWLDAGGRVAPPPPAIEADVIVDAMFGTGLARPLKGEFLQAVRAINAASAPALAVDAPSGLNCDTGAPMPEAVRAAATVAFITRKRGMHTGAGVAHCGALLCDDLGARRFEPAGVDGELCRLLGGADLRRALPPRPAHAHKGLFGHTLVVGGNFGMAGAARLAAEAALRCGSGLTSVAAHPENAAAISAGRPELMTRAAPDAEALAPLLERATVLVVGCGLGRDAWAQALFARALDARRAAVIDADGLNLLAADPDRRDDWILTPHSGEAARLLGCAAAEIEADRFAAAREVAARYGGACVLKGRGTIIAAQDSLAVCGAGNPGMATGGMGDTLAGVIGALRAQGLPPARAAEIGAVAHAVAGDMAARRGARGTAAADLMPYLRLCLNSG